MSADGPIARSDRVDAMKFFAIALVVLGHVVALPRYDGALGELLYVIRSINMPMFMLLSGYVLFGREGTSPFRFVGRKFMALIVPYFSWVVFDLIRAGTPLSKWLAALVGAAVNPYAVAGRKWFLYVLFVFYVLFTLARAIGKQDAILVLMAVATIGLTFLPPGEYLGRFNIEWLFTFFVVGYLSCKYRGRMPSPRWWMAAVALLVYAGLLFIGNLPDGGSGWPPWYVAQSGGFFVLHWRLALSLFLLWKYATALAGRV